MIEVGLYREAVTAQSPGLLQPWVTNVAVNSIRNGFAAARVWDFDSENDATALRLKSSADVFPGLKQPWALGRNRFAEKELPSSRYLRSEVMGVMYVITVETVYPQHRIGLIGLKAGENERTSSWPRMWFHWSYRGFSRPE